MNVDDSFDKNGYDKKVQGSSKLKSTELKKYIDSLRIMI